MVWAFLENIMHLLSIELHDYPELGRDHTLRMNFDRSINLLVGPNGTGKSTVLRELFNELLPYLDEDEDDEYGAENPNEADLQDPFEGEREPRLSVSNDWPKDGEGQHTRSPIPVLNIPSVRLSGTDYELMGDISGQVDFGIRAIIGTRVLDGTDLLYNWQLPERFRNEIATVVSDCFRCICPEVLDHISVLVYHPARGTSVPTFVIPQTGQSETPEGEYNNEVQSHSTSSGTHNTLEWIRALVYTMARAYQWREGWEKKPAILLIDEIENHLHPTWQRRVIPALLEHFPGLQIFATTHSPFVVAGLRAGQVHLLKRDENGVVTATTNTEDIIGWTADEILRTMMGVDEPTDQLTVDRTNRLRELRRQEKLTSAEESELNTLRRQVSEALLFKGGPIEAQRERYADLMQRFLLSRQSDMTQDGE